MIMATAITPYIGIPLRGRISGFRRFTVDEYHKLIDIGMLTEDDDLELLDGHLVKKMSRKPPHDMCIDLFREAVSPLIGVGRMLRCQQAVTLTASEPEPDFAVVRGTARTFGTAHPTPAEIALLVEVSDTTLDTDREDKGPLYAAATIPVYWIVNIPDRQIEVYTDPDTAADPPAYRTRTDYTPGQDVPLVLDGQTVASIPVADLLP
jgi:Uma2 family endonuclease